MLDAETRRMKMFVRNPFVALGGYLEHVQSLNPQRGFLMQFQGQRLSLQVHPGGLKLKEQEAQPPQTCSSADAAFDFNV